MTVDPSRGRRRVRLAAGVLTVLCGAWCAWLLVHGGFTIHAFGVVIRSNDVMRPLAGFFAAFIVWFALTDRTSLAPRWRAMFLSNRAPVWLAVALAAATIAVAFNWGSRVVGGSDSYGYASQADLLLSGHVTIELPRLPPVPWPEAGRPFVPLGFNPVPNAPIMAPKYPPGFSVLLAGFKTIFGQCGVFAVVPLLAGATVLLTFLIGRELTTAWTALGAALLVAVSPTFLYQSVQLMSDVPATAALAAVCYGALRPGWRAALGAGLAASIALLMRPNLAPCIGLLGLWFVYETRPIGRFNRAGWARAATFAVAGAIGPATLAIVNHEIFSSAVHSGYGDISDYFEWSRVIENARLYVWWTVQSQTPLPLVGFVTLLAPVAAFWPGARPRGAVLVFGAVVVALWLEYCLYYTFGVWWFLRFLLPAWPLMMIGAAQALRWVARRLPVPLVLAIGAAVCWYCLWFSSENFVFVLWRLQRGFYTVAQGVRRNVDRRAVIYTNLESGSLRYYSGLVTFNYIDMQPADLDRSVDFFAAHGAHPYLLVEDEERDRAGESASMRVRDAIGRSPVFAYYGGSTIRLFDLAPDGSPSKPTDVTNETLDGPRCPAPVTPRPLVLDSRQP